MKRTGFGVAIAAISMACLVGVAQAGPMTGTFGLTIYHTDTGSGTQGGADQQANLSNPLLTSAFQIGTGTFQGALSFFDNLNPTGSVLHFLNSSVGGVLSGFNLVTLGNTTNSSGGFAGTTVYKFTGNTVDTNPGNVLGGIISHDDGMTLYNVYNDVIASSAFPTPSIDTVYSNLMGAWTLIYVEANGNPAVLDFQVLTANAPPPEVPLPSAVWLFGTVLAGAGLFSQRRRKSRLPATA